MALHSFRQIFLPYCVVLDEDGSFQVLNREYEQLGEVEKGSSTPRRYALKGLGRKGLEDLALKTNAAKTQFWLYDDSSLPDASARDWEVYSQRLRALSKLEKKS